MANIMDNNDLSGRKKREELAKAIARQKAVEEAKAVRARAEKEAIKAKFPDKIGEREETNATLKNPIATTEARKAEQETARIAAEKAERKAEERRRKEIEKGKRRKEKLEKKIAKLTTILGLSGAAVLGVQALTHNPIEGIKEVPKEEVENELKDENLKSKLNLFALNEELVNEIEEKVLNNNEIDSNTVSEVSMGLIKMLIATGLGNNEEINNIQDLRNISYKQQYAIYFRNDSNTYEEKFFVTAADKELTNQSTLRSMIISYSNHSSGKDFINDYMKIIKDKIIIIDDSFNMIALEKSNENLQEELKELKVIKEGKKPTMQEKYGGYNVDTILTNGGTVDLTMIEKSQEQNQQTKQAQEDTTIYRANVDEEER